MRNLDDTIDEAALKELFEPFGSVTSAAVPLDANGKCKASSAVEDLDTHIYTYLYISIYDVKRCT